MIKAKEIEWDGLYLKDKHFPFDIHIEVHQSDISDAVYYTAHFGFISSLGGTKEQAKQHIQDLLNSFINQIAEEV